MSKEAIEEILGTGVLMTDQDPYEEEFNVARPTRPAKIGVAYSQGVSRVVIGMEGSELLIGRKHLVKMGQPKEAVASALGTERCRELDERVIIVGERTLIYFDADLRVSEFELHLEPVTQLVSDAERDHWTETPSGAVSRPSTEGRSTPPRDVSKDE